MTVKKVALDLCVLLGVGAAALALVCAMPAQEPAGATSGATAVTRTVVPPLVRYSGTAANRTGDTVEAVFRIYAAPEGGEPLWSETQRVSVGPDGKYSILLGAASQNGLPAQVFAAGEGRWLGVSFERAPEAGRTPLVSVAYAMKAGDADTLGGLAPGQFVTQAQLASTARQMASDAAQAAGPAPQISPTGAGTLNYLPLWTGAATLGNSALYQGGTAAAPLVGLATTVPNATLDVGGTGRFRRSLYLNSGGAATATAGVSSPQLLLYASSFLANGARPIQQTFAWQAVPANNNTSSPSANLNLLYSMMGAAPAPTGLSIYPSGVIQFAPNQNFPGALTGVAPGFGLTGGGVSNGIASFNIDAGLVPTMSSANKFSAVQNLNAGLNATGPVGINGSLTATGIATFSSLAQGSTAIFKGPNAVGPAVSVAGGAEGLLASGSQNGITGASTATSIGDGTGSGVIGIGPVGLTGYGTQFGARVTSTGSRSTALYASSAGGIGMDVEGGGLGLNVASVGDQGEAINATSPGWHSIGVRSVSGFASTTGAKGISYLGPVQGVAMWADSGLSYETTSLGTSLLVTADNNNGAMIANNSGGPSTLFAINYGSGPRGFAVPVIHTSGASGDCILNSNGDSICTGAHKSAVSVAGGTRQVEMYGVHAAENWFEDFGAAQLVHGVAVVKIDPAFAETVNGEAGYHVFLTPQGDCEGLYVTNKTAIGFEVHELRKGASSVSFDYRITARRAGHEVERMVDVTEQMRGDPIGRVPGGPGGLKPVQP